MKRTLLGALLLLLAVAASPAVAKICTVDSVPAATLLTPHFDVDLNNPNGQDTVLTLVNASATAVIAHATLWTDLGIPTFAFDMYLTGYDEEKIDLRLLFSVGQYPPTADAGTDPSDLRSPKGPFSQDINFPGGATDPVCTVPVTLLDAATIAHLRNAHSGAASATFSGNCSAQPINDGHARGYVTIDAVNSCGSGLPGTAGYFTGRITFQNVLFGKWELIARNGTGIVGGGAMIAIEGPFQGISGVALSSPDFPLTEITTPGQYTFYGAYNDTAWNAEDKREPLPTNWEIRYLNGLGGATTSLIVWRDPGVKTAPFACGAAPPWYPLGQLQFAAFDDLENPSLPAGANLFPAATNLVPVSALGIAANAGWAHMNLNLPAADPSAVPPENPRARQAWVGALTAGYASNRLSIPGFATDSGCTARNITTLPTTIP